MEIREATQDDIPAIVDLLKLSLGESLMPKSEQYWRWKHVENPFGVSPVLLAWDNELLVGVRAFMRWEWMGRERVYRAVRAVDTATHPDHQGKGIFKKLTLALVDYRIEQGDHFVFNTPNQQSKPGYIKMGWQEAGRLPIKVALQKPFRMLKSFILRTNQQLEEQKNTNLGYYLDHPKLDILLKKQRRSASLHTNVSAPYLAWRYQQVPVANYFAIGEENSAELTGLIIGRVKTTVLGRELRITDCFIDGDVKLRELPGTLRRCQKEWGIDYTTFSGAIKLNRPEITGYISVSSRRGPIVTVRPLRENDLGSLKNFTEWSPSLGDLELF